MGRRRGRPRGRLRPAPPRSTGQLLRGGGVPRVPGRARLLGADSANRDETQFDDPHTFDVRRHPNPHLAFGGGGPHFCLGASLARREISVMFDEIRRRLPGLEVTGPPSMLHSSFIHGIKSMPCAW